MAETYTREAIDSCLMDVFAKHKHGDAVVGMSSVITADLGVDSLGVMEIVAALEDTFGLTFPEEDLPGIRTVADVADLIERGLRAGGRMAL